jgi:hypothetical protein
MLTLPRLRDRIATLRGQADDLEAERRYVEAGVKRELADELEAEIDAAVLYDAGREGARS